MRPVRPSTRRAWTRASTTQCKWQSFRACRSDRAADAIGGELKAALPVQLGGQHAFEKAAAKATPNRGHNRWPADLAPRQPQMGILYLPLKLHRAAGAGQCSILDRVGCELVERQGKRKRLLRRNVESR